MLIYEIQYRDAETLDEVIVYLKPEHIGLWLEEIVDTIDLNIIEVRTVTIWRPETC